MKSFVSLEQAVCPICGIKHDTGVLIHKNLRPVLESKTVTHMALCPEHKAKHEEGYLALVAVKNVPQGNTLKPQDADRTGEVVHIRRHIADQIFNVQIPHNLPMIYIEPGIIDKLKEMMS